MISQVLRVIVKGIGVVGCGEEKIQGGVVIVFQIFEGLLQDKEERYIYVVLDSKVRIYSWNLLRERVQLCKEYYFWLGVVM